MNNGVVVVTCNSWALWKTETTGEQRRRRFQMCQLLTQINIDTAATLIVGKSGISIPPSLWISSQATNLVIELVSSRGSIANQRLVGSTVYSAHCHTNIDWPIVQMTKRSSNLANLVVIALIQPWVSLQCIAMSSVHTHLKRSLCLGLLRYHASEQARRTSLTATRISIHVNNPQYCCSKSTKLSRWNATTE